MGVDAVQLYYPNEWKKHIKLLEGTSVPNSFDWFLCSFRMYDEETGLYYASISPNVQFYCRTTGKTLLARGLSKRGEGIETKIVRPRLLILNDPYNRKVLCGTFDCSMKKRLRAAINLGFDGAVVEDPQIADDDLLPICLSVTFIFRKGILESVGKMFPDRCGMIRFAKSNNTKLRERYAEDVPSGGTIMQAQPSRGTKLSRASSKGKSPLKEPSRGTKLSRASYFPTCQEIDELLKTNSCATVSYILFELMMKGV